jgi:Icc-related predicted phosphoesterase
MRIRVFGKRKKDSEIASGGMTLYYAGDVHGSEVCWKKFLGAAKAYGVDALVLGGDLAGKALVPIEWDGDRFSARFLGERRTGSGEKELSELVAAVRYNGMYPWVTTKSEIERVQGDPAVMAEVFEEVLKQEHRRWIEIADERLSALDLVGAYAIAGNDDPDYLDEILASSKTLTFCDERVVDIGGHELLSFSYANPTPWDSPRELDEDALYDRLKALAETLEHPRSSIFNLHAPPYDSGLDTAAELDENFSPVFDGGNPVEVPVGSKAVRQIIEEYQPLLGLHGHIHESRAQGRIGKTLVLNPGSEYNTGQIHGAIVHLDDEIDSVQFVVG